MRKHSIDAGTGQKVRIIPSRTGSIAVLHGTSVGAAADPLLSHCERAGPKREQS